MGMRAFSVFLLMCLSALGCANRKQYHTEEQKVVKELRALNDGYLKKLFLLPKTSETKDVLLDVLLKCVADMKLLDYEEYYGDGDTIIHTPISLENTNNLIDLAKKFRKEIEECVNVLLDEKEEAHLYIASEREVDNLSKIVSFVRIMGLVSLRYFTEGNVAMGTKYIVAILKVAQRLSYSSALISWVFANLFVKWVVDILGQHLGDISPKNAKVIEKEMEFFTTASFIERLRHIQASWLATNIRWYVSIYPDSLLSRFVKGDRYWVWGELYKSFNATERQKVDCRLFFIKLILFAIRIYERQQTALNGFLGSSGTKATLPETRIALSKTATRLAQEKFRTASLIELPEDYVNALLQGAYLSEVFLCVLRIHRHIQEKQEIPTTIDSFLNEVARRKIKKYITYRIAEDGKSSQVTFADPLDKSKQTTWQAALRVAK